MITSALSTNTHKILGGAHVSDRSPAAKRTRTGSLQRLAKPSGTPTTNSGTSALALFRPLWLPPDAGAPQRTPPEREREHDYLPSFAADARTAEPLSHVLCSRSLLLQRTPRHPSIVQVAGGLAGASYSDFRSPTLAHSGGAIRLPAPPPYRSAHARTAYIVLTLHALSRRQRARCLFPERRNPPNPSTTAPPGHAPAAPRPVPTDAGLFAAVEATRLEALIPPHASATATGAGLRLSDSRNPAPGTPARDNLLD
ncbi:hypothetical protein GY45DRAFT_624098 [Cubamyces sp. BRFM 1775]|nr:hypothetical protein GY45DRAFT_624098 [Cubamyces sp. BRFM 1775]